MGNQIILKTTLSGTGVELIQDSKTKQFNVTALFDSANKTLGTQRRIEDWVKSKSAKELYEYRKSLILSHSEKLVNGDNQQVTKEQEKEAENQVLKITKSRQTKDGWIKGKVVAEYRTKQVESHLLKIGHGDNQQVTKEASEQVLKIYKGRLTKEGRTKDRVVADPVMTLDAATYLDVALKNEVYEYYLDDKAQVRNKMTEDYKSLCSLVSRNIAKTKDVYEQMAYNINGIVFDKFVGHLWNENCTKEQYKELDDIMVKLIGLIEEGYVDTLTKLMVQLDKWYEKKWGHLKFKVTEYVEVK